MEDNLGPRPLGELSVGRGRPVQQYLRSDEQQYVLGLCGWKAHAGSNCVKHVSS